MVQRYVLEGEWSGYRSEQRRVVHREVVTGKRADRLRDLHTILYTDGTTLNLRLRPAKPREKIVAIDGYGSLIRQCETHIGKHAGALVRVEDLP